ncbi:MAG: hypothetical protein PUD55_01130 [Firmicutes bacterium]|nr:hypothetical protein [Bacillota bacterium]
MLNFTKHDPAIFTDEAVLARCEALRDMPQEVIDMYAAAWKKVKSA